MAVVQVPFMVAVLLLVSPGLHCSSPPPACPESCTCQRAPLLNCSSSGLSSVPQHIQDSVAELDLSQNRLDTVTLYRPYRNLRNVWLENNTITRLSLCIDKNLGTQSVRGRHSGQLGPLSRRRCVSWAPALQLLSVERNQLIQLPEGLEGSASLWVLQLSFNRISTLRPGELRHLRQLKELHLKHNLITNLHPQMFQDLAQLRVLDLSFNMLTNLHPSMYLSLRNIGSNVRLDGNRWQCDCSMRSLRRRMAYDSNRGLQTWGVVCAFPSVLSGKDLLQLEEDDLNCFGTENSPELHRDVTVYSGSEILLSCSKQDSSWLTPSGQESVSGSQAPLFIGDVTDKDTGLYVCMTEDHEVVSVFNLQISRVEHARRKTRSLPRASRQVIPLITTNRIGQERNQSATQSDLTLAVCLSVFITFLIAFILGVLARPCIDILCKKVSNKRSPSATNSVSSAEQRQYENEAYSEGEEPDEIVTDRERRVTFSTGNNGQDINVEYYDTVASGNQKSAKAAKTKEDEPTAGDSGSENGSGQINPEYNQRDARDISGTTDTRRKHKVQFDHIPDSEKLEERSLSSCSDSSLSDRELKKEKINKRGHTSPESLQRAEDSVQQGAVEELPIERTSEIPEFSSEPFSDGSPHAADTKPTDSDLCQGNEEQFDFSDSVGSNSARSSSLFSSFNDSKRKVLPTSDSQSSNDVSSCSSSLSEDEPTQYTVNPDQEEEETENNHNKSELTNTCLKQDASFQQQISGVDTSKPPVEFNQGNYPHDTLRPAERPEQTFSSQSSNSEQMTEYYKPSSRVVAGERDTREKIKPMPRSKWRGVSLGVTSFGKSLDPKAPSPPAAYSSSYSSESDAEITDRKVKHNKVRKSKKYFDINAPFSASNSSSSDETRDDTTKHTKKQQQEEYQSGASKDRYNATYPEWTNQTTSPCNDSTSSDESADQIMDHMQKKGEMHMTSVQYQESHTASHDSDTQWPALDLENTTRIKRRLDIKAPSPSPEDETTGHTEKKRPQKVDHSGLLLKESQTKILDPDAKWPALDLENIPTIKRRQDIKAPSPHPDSSSSSDSDDETKYYTESPGKVDIANPSLKQSQILGHNIHTGWPALDLEHIPTIKRRLDVNAPSPHPDSSSSSDSEDETTGHTDKKIPQKVDHSGLLLKESQTATHGPDARWPALDLENIPTIKRRLDVKAPSPPPDSSSSSDSVDETTHLTKRPGKVDIIQIKKHDSGSSSSSESDDEKTGHTEKKIPQKVDHSGLLLKESQTANLDPDARWPALELENIPTIKRRLDIKAPSPRPDSSSSSDSEDETTGHPDKKIPQKVDHSGLLLKESQTATHAPDARWPALDLENIPTIKRRLDVKAPSPPPDSSSNSDSEDETTHLTKRPGKGDISQIKKHDSGSSSSSESDDETTGHTEKKIPLKIYHSGLLLKESQTANLDPDARWPALDLENILTIKRRLDIKALSPHPDSSSSSDSEDEPTNHQEKQNQGDTHIAKLPIVVSQTKWPALDLEHTTPIKRRLDIKVPSPPPDSSSSSDSDDETTPAAERPAEVGNAALPLQTFPTATHDPDAKWPALDLENIPTIKRRLDVKAPSPSPDSSSSSDSEDETTHLTKRPGKVDISQIKKHDSRSSSSSETTHLTKRPGKVDIIQIKKHDSGSSSSSESDDEKTGHTEKKIPQKVDHSGLLLKESQTANLDPDARWPALELENIPTIKRRLDIKAPSPRPDSSSSSDSEDETTGHPDKKIPQKVDHSGLLLKESQTATHAPDARWPALDLENIPTIKRRLDVKAPSPPPDSSSNSDSEDETTHLTKRPGKGDISQIKKHDSGSSSSSESDDETTGHTEKKIPLKIYHSGLLLKESQTANLDPDARWPALDLENILTIKRRLDIKALSPHPDSSSSSDSEDEPTNHQEKQNQGDTHIAKLPIVVSQTKWPALDLEHTTPIKRRLDIKVPSPPPDSSSSSDSDDETTPAAERPAEVGNAALPLQTFPTATHDPDAKWPALDLENIPTIKRRLDVKAPSPSPDSSSSSDSEDETTHLTKRPGKVDISQIKKHDSRSSSSSESDAETTGHTEKKIPLKIYHSGLLLKESQTANLDTDAKWPVIDLEHIPTIKRRLDVKAPSPSSDSSSSSDGEDETTGYTEKKRPQKVDNSGLLLKESQTANLDPDARWPALDLENIPTIKRRLDIKAPSPHPDSSSSSDSDDETTHAAERPGKVSNAALLLKKIPTATHDQDARWPALDLENIPTIKRRLDVKAPSPPPDSSSSSDSEDETTHLTKRPGKGDISQIKKHDSGSSSSSESDDEIAGHTEKKIPLKIYHSGLLLKESQTANLDTDAKWPALDLENIPTIKRRLDIKAPSPHPGSSSSSDSDDETIHAAERPGKVGNAALPLQKFPTATHDQDARWPALDLAHIPTIKRRLDVKAPSPSPDSYSSSDSEDETPGYTQKKRPQKVKTSGLLLRESQTANLDPDARWLAIDLQNIPTIKRRLDIKAPSLDSNSSSSSDNEEDITHHKGRPGKIDIVPIKKHEQGKFNLSTFPLHESETVSYDPLGSAVNLNNITRIKRRLDIKAPSSPPKSLSYESTEYTEDMSNPSMTIKPHPDPRWPELGLSSAPCVNRHLDIKTHSPSTESSSSSDKSDSESTSRPVKVERDRTVVGITNYQPGTQFPDMKVMHNINLGIPKIRRRLDIKAPSPQPDLVLDSTSADVRESESNSSTSESEDDNRDQKFKWSTKSPLIKISPKPKTEHTIKLEKYTVITDDLRDKPTNDNISPTPEINPELQSRWDTMNLGVSRFRKRLDITSHTNVPPNLPTSPLPDSGKKSSRTRLKKNLVKVTEEKSNPDTRLTGFGTPRVTSYLDTKVREKAPGTSPLHQQSDSLSSSESEGIETEYAGYKWRGTSQMSFVPDVAAPQNHTSLLVTHAADESRSGTQVERTAGVELKIQATEEGDASDLMWPHLSLTNIPHVKRALDIRAPLQRESFSSSNSDDETDHTVPELKPGVPRINRRLNIKAPSSEPNTSSSSSSESDNKVTGYSAKQSLHSSNMTDDNYSQIAYKRSIIKAPRQRNSFSASGRSHTSDHPVAQAGLSHRMDERSASHSPWGVSSIEQQSTIDVPPGIRWTGIGRNLPDFSSASRRLDLGLPPPQRIPPAEPELTPPDSSNSSDKIKQDRVKAYESLMHRFSYPAASRVSVASSRSLDKFENTSKSKNESVRGLSEDRQEKKGLGALKAISSKRHQWDIEDKDKDAV